MREAALGRVVEPELVIEATSVEARGAGPMSVTAATSVEEPVAQVWIQAGV